MHINWLGQTCIKLQAKNLRDEDVIIFIDPYKPEKGDFPRSIAPQVVLFSSGQEGSITLSQNPFIMDTLGEMEIKGTMVYSLPGPNNSNEVVFKITAEGMTIVHLGKIAKKLNTETIAKIASPDILFVPVGGTKNGTLEAEDAVATVTALEPRIVIPIAYQCDSDPKAGSVDDFIKNLGIKAEATEKKIILKKKDLPQEETKVFILEKNY